MTTNLQIPEDAPLLKVAKGSVPKSVGSAIARELEKHPLVIVRAIGVNAVNQAVKGVAIAGGFVGQRGKTLMTRIGLSNVPVEELGGGVESVEEHNGMPKVLSAVNLFCTIV